MAYGVWFSMLNYGQARKVFSAAMCKWRQRSILSIPKMSDKYDTQASRTAHLDTICSQKAKGYWAARAHVLQASITIFCNSTGRCLITEHKNDF